MHMIGDDDEEDFDDTSSNGSHSFVNLSPRTKTNAMYLFLEIQQYFLIIPLILNLKLHLLKRRSGNQLLHTVNR